MKWRNALSGINDYHPGKKRPGNIKLSSNENPLGPSPLAIVAVQRQASQVAVYPSMVSAELNEAIASWRGVQADQVIAGNGSDEVFSFCAAALIEEGTNAVGSRHSFSQYEFSTSLFGGEYRAVEMNDLHFDLTAIAGAIDKDTRIVFLCSPNNPTGRIIPAADLRNFVETTRDDILIVIDQAYREYADSAEYLDAATLIGKHKNVLVTGTFSKLFGLAALRIGYGLADRNIIKQLLKVKSPFNINSSAQAGAIAAINDRDFAEQSLELNRSSRKRFSRELSRRNIGYLETQGNFICVKSPTGNAAEAAALLESRGISVRDLCSFGMPEYLRITLAEPELMARIAEILGEL